MRVILIGFLFLWKLNHLKSEEFDRGSSVLQFQMFYYVIHTWQGDAITAVQTKEYENSSWILMNISMFLHFDKSHLNIGTKTRNREKINWKWWLLQKQVCIIHPSNNSWWLEPNGNVNAVDDKGNWALHYVKYNCKNLFLSLKNFVQILNVFLTDCLWILFTQI